MHWLIWGSNNFWLCSHNSNLSGFACSLDLCTFILFQDSKATRWDLECSSVHTKVGNILVISPTSHCSPISWVCFWSRRSFVCDLWELLSKGIARKAGDRKSTLSASRGEVPRFPLIQIYDAWLETDFYLSFLEAMHYYFLFVCFYSRDILSKPMK